MKIQFCLFQAKVAKDSKRAQKNYFKLDLCHSLYAHYTDRIIHYRPIETLGPSFENFMSDFPHTPGAKILCCDLGSHSKNLTSEALADRIREWEIGGFQHLYVLLGPADGFQTDERAWLKQRGALFWSLGAQTLPHDLAAVIAAEQIYRAMTILKGEPYHLGH